MPVLPGLALSVQTGALEIPPSGLDLSSAGRAGVLAAAYEWLEQAHEHLHRSQEPRVDQRKTV